MTIEKKQNGSSLTIAVQGRLDTTTAPDLEKEIKSSLDGVTELIMDFEKLDYISSAGLRVLLSAQKVMSKQGSMKDEQAGQHEGHSCQRPCDGGFRSHRLHRYSDHRIRCDMYFIPPGRVGEDCRRRSIPGGFFP